MGWKELTHIVHLYGRFLLKTSNSKPAVSNVSQLSFASSTDITIRFHGYEDERTCRDLPLHD